VSGRSRARDRCWNSGCLPCEELTRLATARYIERSLRVEWQLDRSRAQAKRRCLLITLSGEPNVTDQAAFRDAVVSHFRPWLDRRVGLAGRYFGVIVPMPKRKGLHAHIVAVVDEHLPCAGDLWHEDHPPSVRGVLDPSPRGLYVQLLRHPDEFALKGGPLRHISAIPKQSVRNLATRDLISGPRYVAAQVPPLDVPKGSTWVLQGRDFSKLGTFASFRDEFTDRIRHLPHVPRTFGRAIPTFDEAERRAAGSALGAIRRVSAPWSPVAETGASPARIPDAQSEGKR